MAVQYLRAIKFKRREFMESADVLNMASRNAWQWLKGQKHNTLLMGRISVIRDLSNLMA